MPRFDNQTVLVTGGTGGQGSSHVRAFHAEGANVVIGDIDAERGAALAAESAFGALNVLVNNAGVQNPPAAIENTEQATWSRILDINLTGTFLGIKVAAPLCAAQQGEPSSTSPRPWAWAARLTTRRTSPASGPCEASPKRQHSSSAATTSG
jgi:NAD(P)-dependent dehydrogenase (short-subunit alcohol dehydrogenase family)